MQIFVQINTVGADAGPFMIYSNVDGYVTAYGVQISAAALLNGIILTVPDYTTSIRIRSNGKCTNSIEIDVPCEVQTFTMQASGITHLTFSNFVSFQPVTFIWQTGVEETWNPGDPIPTHTYTSAYTGDIIIQACDLSTITTFEISNSPSTLIQPSNATLTIKDIELTKLVGLTNCKLYSPSINFTNNGGSTTSTMLLPPALQVFWTNVNTMTGNVSNLPAGLLQFVSAGTNTINGLVSSIPSNMQMFEVLGLNTISGLIGDMPSSMISFVVFGLNTIHGKLSDIKGDPSTPNQSNTNPTLQAVNILGNNYIQGDLGDINWGMVTVFNLGGLQYQPTPETTSYLTGDLDALPAIPPPYGDGVHKFRLDIQVLGHHFGYSTITGDISNLPNTSTFYNLELGGGNNAYTNPGYVGNPSAGYQAYPVGGWGITISGDLSDVPQDGMVTLSLGGLNTIDGDVANFVAPACDHFQVLGNNTIYGDISNLPPKVRFVDIQGGHNVNTYSVSRPWIGGATPPFGMTPYSMCRFILNSSVSGYRITDQTQLDTLISDLQNSPLWVNYGSIASEVRIRSSQTPSGAAITDLANLNTRILALPGGVGATVIS